MLWFTLRWKSRELEKERKKMMEEENWYEECYEFIKSDPDITLENHRLRELITGAQAWVWAKHIKKDAYSEIFHIF
jgi:N-acetyl-beta-hexosaminidase